MRGRVCVWLCVHVRALWAVHVGVHVCKSYADCIFVNMTLKYLLHIHSSTFVALYIWKRMPNVK